MKKYCLLAALLLSVPAARLFAQTLIGSRMNEVFQKTNLSSAGNLNNPWEITYGPDDSLWVTESKGYRVFKMSPNTANTSRIILDLSLKSTWLGSTPASDSVFNIQFDLSTLNPQGGLAGLALHPDFNAAIPKKYVYISYVRSYLGTGSGDGSYYMNRVVRFTYNPADGKLSSPVSLCDTLPGSNDHNSQRIIIAPLNGVNYLFYAQGDMGAGQFNNSFRPNHAQDSSSYEGKILRFNLEPDADVGTLDKWIPNDNPFNSGPLQSAVWAIGLRNNQGLAFDSVRNILYGSSHGPYSDDEINIIDRAKNYGHPLVEGYADGNYNGFSAGNTTGSSLPTITDEIANASTIGASYQDPIFSGYAASNSVISNIFATNPSNSTWPSEGWSGLGLYNNSIIPGWKNSLLMAGLKFGRLIRTKLNATGTGIASVGGQDTVCYFDGVPRYRDMAFGPNGKDIYVVMDNSNSVNVPPSANNPLLTQCFGCVQKFTFLGYASSAGTSTIPSTVPVAAGKANLCENANTININAMNTNFWVPITDTLGNIVAEINANGNILGQVTTSVFVNSGAVREQQGSHSLYLDRNITITPQTPPSGTVSLRLYLTAAEFNALAAATNSLNQPSGITAATDLTIFKNSDNCGPEVALRANAITTTHQAAFGTDGYVVQGDITSFSTFYIAGISAVLPIHLVSFKGNVLNDISRLNWITDNEQGMKNFVLERSSNGRDFTALTSIPARNAAGQQSYSYSDSSSLSTGLSIVYYRLKMAGSDDTYSYSPIVSLNLKARKGSISIHPNPVVNEVTVDINAAAAEQTSWMLTDITGKAVLQRPVTLLKGPNSFTITLNSLPAGMYYLKFAGNNLTQAVKLQKQ